jgi:hypothetical protein
MFSAVLNRKLDGQKYSENPSNVLSFALKWIIFQCKLLRTLLPWLEGFLYAASASHAFARAIPAFLLCKGRQRLPFSRNM